MRVNKVTGWKEIIGEGGAGYACYLQRREAALAFAVRHVVKERLQIGWGCNCLTGLRYTVGFQVKSNLLALSEGHPILFN